MHAWIQKLKVRTMKTVFFAVFFSGVFFSVNEGKRIQIRTKVGHHRPASETPFKWCFAGRPMMTQH